MISLENWGLAFRILEHLKEPHLTVEKIYNSLRREGVIIGSVPNNFGLIGGFTTWFINTFIDKTHCSTYPPFYWSTLFKEAGFKKITFFGEVIFSRNLTKYVKRSFWKYVSHNLMFLCRK